MFRNRFAMRYFVHLFLTWLLAAIGAHSRSISISPTCDTHADQLSLGLCLRPFLDAWEILRQHEATAAHIVFPTLYYSRQEILTLCDFYLESLDTCMDSHVLEACSNSPLLSFVKSQVGFICTSRRAVKFLSMFDCISGAFRATPECRDHIRGLPLPELQANKCQNMPGFFTCLEREIYNRCSTDGLVTLIRAIEGFGCDTRMLQLNLEDFDVLAQTETTAPVQLTDEKTSPSDSATIPPNSVPVIISKSTAQTDSTPAVTQQESLLEDNQIPAKSNVNSVDIELVHNGELEKLDGEVEATEDQNQPKESEMSEVSDVSEVLEVSDVSEVSEVSEASEISEISESNPVVSGSVIPNNEVMQEKNIRIMSVIDEIQFDMGSGNEEEERPQEVQVVAVSKAQTTTQSSSSVVLDSKAVIKEDTDLVKSILAEELEVTGIRSPEVVEVPLEGSGDVPGQLTNQEVEPVPSESNPPEKTILTEVVGAGVKVQDSDGPVLHILVNQPPSPTVSELPVEQPVDPSPVSSTQEIIIKDPSVAEVPKEQTETEATPFSSKSIRKPEVAFKLTSKPESEEIVESRCSPIQEAHIMKCLVPLSERWQRIEIRDPAVGKFRFSLFNHKTEDLIDLCDVVQVTFEDCITGDLLRDCRSNIFIKFVETQLGLACGSKQRDFFLSYDCLLLTHLAHGSRCLEHVRGSLIPGMSDEERCAGIPEYFSCMEEEILESCNPTSHFIFLEAVQNFGCDIRKKPVAEEKVVVSSPSENADIQVEDKEVKKLVDTAAKESKPPVAEEKVSVSSGPEKAEIQAENLEVKKVVDTAAKKSKTPVAEEKVAVSSGSENAEIQVENLEVKQLVDTAGEKSIVKIPEDKVIDPPTKKSIETTVAMAKPQSRKIKVKTVPPFQPVLSSQCTPAVQGEVRACLLPLMEFWVGVRNQKTELNNISFPIFKYKQGELLSLCDEYANAFLQCDFALFEVCLGDEMVRFANNNLGYLCSPQNVQPFMKHFDCISEQVRNSPEECLELIHGPSLPGMDTMRCTGIEEFHRCVAPRVKSSCQPGALFEFQETIVQFGCQIDRSLV